MNLKDIDSTMNLLEKVKNAERLLLTATITQEQKKEQLEELKKKHPDLDLENLGEVRTTLLAEIEELETELKTLLTKAEEEFDADGTQE